MIKKMIKNIINFILKMKQNESKKHSHDIELVRKNIKIMNSFNTPKDDYERSYFQYKCQITRTGDGVLINLIKAMGNMLSFFIVVLLLIMKPKKVTRVNKNNDACYFSHGSKDLIPFEEIKLYDNIVVLRNNDLLYNKNVKKYLICLIKKYPFSYLFVLKNIAKIAIYENMISKYNPISIIDTALEASYSSSILTNYCEKYGVNHISVQHGEIDFRGITSFFRFTKCYLWNNHFVDICLKQRTEKTQFKVAVPKCLIFEDKNQICKYKYFLQAQSNEDFKIIRSTMDKISDDYIVRNHPTYYKKDDIEGFFENKNIEDAEKVNIEDSIMESEYIISESSTVLYQAYLNGKIVVMDDVTHPNIISFLDEINYIMLNKPHKLLSELLKEIESENENE